MTGRLSRLADTGWNEEREGPVETEGPANGAGGRGRFNRWLARRSLNGHLLPFVGLWGTARTMSIESSPSPARIGLCRSVLYTGESSRKGFVAKHRKSKFFGNWMRARRIFGEFERKFRELSEDFDRNAERICSPAAWGQRFGFEGERLEQCRTLLGNGDDLPHDERGARKEGTIQTEASARSGMEGDRGVMTVDKTLLAKGSAVLLFGCGSGGRRTP